MNRIDGFRIEFWEFDEESGGFLSEKIRFVRLLSVQCFFAFFSPVRLLRFRFLCIRLRVPLRRFGYDHFQRPRLRDEYCSRFFSFNRPYSVCLQNEEYFFPSVEWRRILSRQLAEPDLCLATMLPLPKDREFLGRGENLSPGIVVGRCWLRLKDERSRCLTLTS